MLLVACLLMVLPSLLGIALLALTPRATRRVDTLPIVAPPQPLLAAPQAHPSRADEVVATVIDVREGAPTPPPAASPSRRDALVEVVLCDDSSGTTVIDAVVVTDPTGLLGPEGSPVSFAVALGQHTLIDVCGRLTGWARDGAHCAVTAVATGDKVIALLRAPGLAVPTTVLDPAIH